MKREHSEENKAKFKEYLNDAKDVFENIINDRKTLSRDKEVFRKGLVTISEFLNF